MDASRPTYAEINLTNLRFNLRSSREFIGRDLKCMAVVKANAYGHGAVECSRVLEGEGVDWLGVALVEEAVELRKAGIKTPILCLGGFYEDQEALFTEYSVTPVVLSIKQAQLLSGASGNLGSQQNIHIKIDTGFGRIGVWWEEVADFAKQLSGLSNLNVDGLMTHFAAADDPAENDFTNEQIRRFYESVDIFHDLGFSPSFIDLANSPGAVGHPNSRGNMVRLGGILYGLGDDTLPRGINRPELRPVLSLYSRIAYLKRVPKGESLGYGRTFFTKRDSLIATVPVGFHDGYRRGLSNKSRVIISNQYAPVVGRVSMDWIIIDVTDIGDVIAGSEVILIGSRDSLVITAAELAGFIDTISYEVTCGIGSRVPRNFVE
jgi:alanine racemase